MTFCAFCGHRIDERPSKPTGWVHHWSRSVWCDRSRVTVATP